MCFQFELVLTVSEVGENPIGTSTILLPVTSGEDIPVVSDGHAVKLTLLNEVSQCLLEVIASLITVIEAQHTGLIGVVLGPLGREPIGQLVVKLRLVHHGYTQVLDRHGGEVTLEVLVVKGLGNLLDDGGLATTGRTDDDSGGLDPLGDQGLKGSFEE
jgi:hypothetical protein